MLFWVQPSDVSNPRSGVSGQSVSNHRLTAICFE